MKKKKADSKKKPISPKKKSNTTIQARKSPNTKIKTVSTQETVEKCFHIAGMCASAGGLEAFEQFFKNMPSDSGIGFILVPHLDPTHKSIMVDLIKRCTDMGVVEAKDGVKVQPNCIYVIPPNNDLALLNGSLQLLEPVGPRGQRHPIDYFLRTLGNDQGEKAICVILSGTGSDGTVGLKAIKGGSGMVMVQDPITAKYDGMPRSAIETNMVDYILPANKMPEQMIKYVQHSNGRAVKKKEALVKAPDSLHKIFILLRSHTGHDFSLYKKNTIIRRIERRMSVHQIDKISDYVRYLQENRHELDLLFKEIIIGVTNFFRDKEAFEVLAAKVCPHLFRGKSPGDSIRIWVVGCSTGEEAYSMAMVVREYMEDKSFDTKVQIFASDIDADAIEVARAGVYPESIAVDVSTQRLKRFFVKQGNTFHASKRIREMIVFAPQNVIKDPPFSKLDMITCRNLLIYLEADLQKKILPLFHYTLKPEGILFLGSSETIGGFIDLFTVLDKKWKFFKRKELASSAYPMIDLPTVFHTDVNREPEKMAVGDQEKTLELSDLIEQMLLENYAPSCLIINQNCDILFINGRTGKYLEPAPGEAKMNVLDMAREGLKPHLQFAIRRCQSENSEVAAKQIQVKGNGSYQMINLFVKPIHFPVHKEGLMMVLFEDVKPRENTEESRGKARGDRNYRKRAGDLANELKYTRENLQTTIEELETVNEELKSTNEELQSTNEELQSTNEELETSKEELNSLNEELVTVNSELQTKMDELILTNNDMKNLLDSTQIGTIFLDSNMTVKRFTPQVCKVINLMGSDIGRPISHISSNLKDERLLEDVERVLRTLVFVEREVQTRDGCWYLIRIMPYRTANNVIDGIVITFVNIDDQMKNERAAKEARVLAEGVLDTVRESLLVLDSGLRVVSANQAFYRKFRTKQEDTKNKLIYELGNHEWDIPRLRELLEEIIPTNRLFNDFEVQHEFEHLGHRRMMLNARRIDLKGDRQDKLILLAIEDVTGHEQTDEK